MQLTSCFTDDSILIDNNETTNAPLASDSEDNEDSTTVEDAISNPIDVAIPELTHHNSSATSAEIQSTDSLILIEDDSDENGEIGNVRLDSHSDSEDTEESAPVTNSSSTLPFLS